MALVRGRSGRLRRRRARARSRDAFCPRRANQLHDAHHSQTVTVYYRLHPLHGQTLTVWRRTRDRHGERVFCRLPDDTICALPTWMFDPVSTDWLLGPPVISVEALSALHDLLQALRGIDGGDEAASLRSRREGVDEATCTATTSDEPAESAASPKAHRPGTGRQTGRADPRPRGAADRSRADRPQKRRR